MWAYSILWICIGIAVIIVCVLEHPTSLFEKLMSEKVTKAITSVTSVPSPFDRFGIVYYINLDHRIDRRQEIENELSSMNIKQEQIHRIPGVVAEAGKGAIGCTMAHINTLTHFLEQTQHETCVVFEDDFKFIVDFKQVEHSIKEFFDEIVNWDVVLLAGKMSINTNEPRKSCHRVFNITTTSGYIVNRTMAPVLLQNYKEGLEKLLKKYNLQKYAIDEYWKRIQEESKWYAFKPLLGTQRESYSDINQKVKEVKSKIKSYPVIGSSTNPES